MSGCWPGALGAALLARLLAASGGISALQVGTSLGMLAVYECVVRSEGAGTLVCLLALVVALHLVSAALDLYRARLLCRASFAHVAELDRRVLEALQARGGRGYALLDDVEQVRRFLTGTGPCAALDALWLPVFVAAVFVLHPLLGVFACAGALLLVALTLAAETRQQMAQPGILLVRRNRYALAHGLDTRRLAGRPCGSANPFLCWMSLSKSYWELSFHAHARALPAIALGKGLRLALQSAGVGLGALLAMEGLINAGAVFAASLLLGRVFACLDAALAHRRGLLAARDSHLRLAAAVAAVAAARS